MLRIRHGSLHEDFNDDELEYNCRKIQMIIVKNKNVDIFK
jgi:hypothetical protein